MKKKVAFICVHNSCRSQIAEAWANHLGGDVLEVYSAGTENKNNKVGYNEFGVNVMAVDTMREVGVSMANQRSKLLKDIPQELDYLITMGCNVSCPHIPAKNVEDWGLEDPSHKGVEAFNETREIIKEKVLKLINSL